MNRRSFITGMSGILMVCTAPAIIRASSLMPIIPAKKELILPWTTAGMITNPSDRIEQIKYARGEIVSITEYHRIHRQDIRQAWSEVLGA